MLICGSTINFVLDANLVISSATNRTAIHQVPHKRHKKNMGPKNNLKEHVQCIMYNLMAAALEVCSF